MSNNQKNNKKSVPNWNQKDERAYQEKLRFLTHYYQELTKILGEPKLIHESDDPLKFPPIIQIGGYKLETQSAQVLRDRINFLRYYVLQDILRAIPNPGDQAKEPDQTETNK